MKKVISIALAILMAFTCCVVAFAAEDRTVAVDKLKFTDGKFRILQVNDTQDVGENADERMVKFVTEAIKSTNPDLVIFNGDQLSDIYTAPSFEDFVIAIANICDVCEENQIPFAVTLGNHDHDRTATVAEDDMWTEIYSKYTYCVNGAVGGSFGVQTDDPAQGEVDYFTCNLPVLSSDESKVAFNIYVMDSNNNEGLNGNNSGYDGITKSQLEWYNAKCAELKAANGGEVVPSMLFQHVPVKEIYSLMDRCHWYEENSIYCRRDGYWYKLKDGVVGDLGEAPCSEDFDTITGQYQAWVENGDVFAAWFAHDHVCNFYGTTEDGISLGYNGGSTFRSYGNGDQRSVRIIDIDENDITNFTTQSVTYAEITGESFSLCFTDLLTPKWLTWVMKAVYAVFGWAIELIQK